MDVKYLVTGTGRSGTVFMARLLTSVGLPCGHEMIFSHDGIDGAVARLRGDKPLELSWASRASYVNNCWVEHNNWLPDPKAVVAESSYMAAPFLSHQCLDSAKVVHVVRDPVRVVNSFCNYIDFFKSHSPSNDYEHFIYARLPELGSKMPQYDRAALYWVRWNQMVERSSPAYFHRVEDGPAGVLGFLGKAGPCFSDASINTFRKSVNERFTPNKVESSVVRDEFVALGKKYGYTMRSDYLVL